MSLIYNRATNIQYRESRVSSIEPSPANRYGQPVTHPHNLFNPQSQSQNPKSKDAQPAPRNPQPVVDINLLFL